MLIASSSRASSISIFVRTGAPMCIVRAVGTHTSFTLILAIDFEAIQENLTPCGASRDFPSRAKAMSSPKQTTKTGIHRTSHPLPEEGTHDQVRRRLARFDDVLRGAALASADPEMADAIDKELGRQRDEIELIASENIVSRAVLEAQGSILTNKYAEGYPGRRYYGGCQFVDIAEKLAIERAKELFSASASPTYSRTPAARPTRACSSPCCSRATRSWASTSPRAAI